MALESGTRFGPYEVGEPIGAGGMGEVYRATDTNLKREVAIKVLPEAFADDSDRLARFQREAEVLASLNHSNIAQIYGLEQSDGKTVIVMELIEGPTLADRIAEGPLPPDEALGIARQIADALEAAHGRQIVHRDLKPANVKLRPDGTVKVLDFGIAKGIDAQVISGGSPVMTTPAVTATGVILGTAAYMAPEQARGKGIDQRTDIWAFGCLLFEMLTGQPAFGGEDVMLTLARVLDRDTDLSSMPGTISPAVRRTIKLCLENDPNKRVADIRDVRLALDGAFDAGMPASAERLAAPPSFPRRALPIAAAAAIAGTIVAFAAWNLRPTPEVRAPNRFLHSIPIEQQFRNFAVTVMDLSPDGRSFVYNTTRGVFLRELGELEARIIPGTGSGVAAPLFSPDGQTLVFFDANDSAVKRIPVTGGAPLTLTDFEGAPTGASWGQDGSILFAQADGIWRVPATGGARELVIQSEAAEAFFGPSVLPDGDSVLFSISMGFQNYDTSQIIVQSLSTGERTVLINGGSDARYLPTGHLIYAVSDDLFAVAFDANRHAVIGGAVPVVQGVARAAQTAGANYAVSNDGTLVYLAGGSENLGSDSLVWVDRDGRETPVGLAPRDYAFVRVSPDGSRIAALISERGNADIWVSDVDRPVLSPITSTAGSEFLPLWTPEGDRVVYPLAPSAGGRRELYWTLADGTGEPEPLLTIETGFLSVEDWSPNTREFVFTYGSFPATNIGLLAADADADGERSWRPLIDRPTSASMLSVSPSGDWIAYQSDDSGDYGVYIERFPDLGSRRAVSTEQGGWAPVWSHDGRELYYRRLDDGAMMAVNIQTAPSLQIGAPEVLFESQNYRPLATPQAGGAAGRLWDVSPDGRFLMIKANVGSEARQIIIVENWFEELKRLVPTN